MKYENSNKNSSTLITLLTLVIVANAIVDIGAAVNFQAFYDGQTWLLMVVLVLMLSSLKAKGMLGDRIRSLLGDAAVLACAAIFGPAAAIITATANRASFRRQERGGFRKRLYDVAACASAANAAGYAVKAVIPLFGLSAAELTVVEIVLAMGAFTITYFLLSTSLYCAYDAIANNESLFHLMKPIFLGTWMRYLTGGAGALAAFFLLGHVDYDHSLLSVIESPHLVAAVAVVMMLLTLHQIIYTKIQSANHPSHATDQ